MKKRSSKIIFASLGALTSISAVSAGLVSCSKNTTAPKYNPIPNSNITPTIYNNDTLATEIFASATIKPIIKKALIAKLKTTKITNLVVSKVSPKDVMSNYVLQTSQTKVSGSFQSDKINYHFNLVLKCCFKTKTNVYNVENLRLTTSLEPINSNFFHQVFNRITIENQIMSQLSHQFSNPLSFSDLKIQPINYNNVKDDQRIKVLSLIVLGQVTIDKQVNKQVNNLSATIKFNYGLFNNGIYNSKIVLTTNNEIISDAQPSNQLAAKALTNQLAPLHILTNVKIKVTSVSKTNQATGMISFTDNLTKTSNMFNNLDFSVNLVNNKKLGWHTNNILGLINAQGKLGRDLAYNDTHTNVLSKFIDATSPLAPGDPNLKFVAGNHHINGWDHSVDGHSSKESPAIAKKITANHQLISASIYKNNLIIKYPGLISTTDPVTKKSTNAYTLTIYKMYNINKAIDTVSATMGNVVPSMTEVSIQAHHIIGNQPGYFKNTSITAVSNDNVGVYSWNISRFYTVKARIYFCFYVDDLPNNIAHRWTILAF